MYGATKEQWDHFVSIGLTHDLLPVVSNPNAKISATSTLKTIGKVPSKYSNGEIIGISEWTTKKATDKAIENWSKESDYGICIQTRYLRAFDIDIESELSNEIKQTILTFFPDAVFRIRTNSLKFVFPFFLNGDHHKRTIQTKEGIIEFLGNGQQFIAAGTHPSGVEYNLPLTNYPTLSEDDFETLFSHILEQYGSMATYANSRKPKADRLDIQDDRIEHLTPLGYGRDGQIFIECPFKDEHTTPSSISATCYFPAGTRAYQQGHFCCLHGHCQGRTNAEFDVALGVIDFDVDETDFTNVPNQETQTESKHDQEIELPRGLIKDTVDWILSCSLQPQPELTLLNVIAFAAAVFGRRYEYDKLGTRTNMYLVGIANTGDGKDHSRKCIKKIAELSNLSRFIGPDAIKSGEGILTMLTKKPSVLMMLDEFGMLMASIGGSNAQPYLRSCAKIFTELYSSSSVLYQGGMYSDPKKDPVNIHCPNLCIYGTSTLIKYAEALTPDAIESGELNRFVVIKPKIDNPEYNFETGSREPPDGIIARWKAIADGIEVWDILGTESGVTNVECNYNTNDLMIYQRQRKLELTDGTGPLYARYTENIIKIAMVFAIAENHNNPLISSIYIDIGRQILDKSTEFMRLLVQSGIGPKVTSKEDPMIDRVYQMTHHAPVTKRDVYRKFRNIHTSEVDRIIDTLVAQGRVKPTLVKGERKSVTTYQAT